SPPDESIPESPGAGAGSSESEAEKAERERKAAEAEAAGARRAAEAKRARERAAAEARRKDDARRAEEANREAAAARLAASEDQARRTLESGINMVTEGRYESAVNTLRSFAGQNPHSADAWYWLARAHHALGDYDRAQTAVNIALEIDPYYGPLSRTPSGLEPTPPLSRQQRKEPPPSMSVLPVKSPLPGGFPLEPVTVSFPYLVRGKDASPDIASDDESPGGARLAYMPYPPMRPGRTAGWMAVSERFSEISRWRFRVDRMGILKEPRVPAAWKGTRPYEVYFWTGREWARIPRSRPREPFDSILYRAREDISQVVTREGLPWDERDTPALAAAASLMRYLWAGDIDFTDASRREAKRQARRTDSASRDEREESVE
ncbi:MAG: tetratricopeptide repeat protein, partial [Synergistaceae bacterium]|nr:tetratricopeptide repeat protein [Synergistaceae bacterium]